MKSMTYKLLICKELVKKLKIISKLLLIKEF